MQGIDLNYAIDMLSGKNGERRMRRTPERLDALASYLQNYASESRFSYGNIADIEMIIADIESRHYRREDSIAKASDIVSALRSHESRILADIGVPVYEAGFSMKGRLADSLVEAGEYLCSANMEVVDTGYVRNACNLVRRAKRRAASLQRRGMEDYALLEDRADELSSGISSYLSGRLETSLSRMSGRYAEDLHAKGISREEAWSSVRRGLAEIGSPLSSSPFVDNNLLIQHTDSAIGMYYGELDNQESVKDEIPVCRIKGRPGLFSRIFSSPATRNIAACVGAAAFIAGIFYVERNSQGNPDYDAAMQRIERRQLPERKAAENRLHRAGPSWYSKNQQYLYSNNPPRAR